MNSPFIRSIFPSAVVLLGCALIVLGALPIQAQSFIRAANVPYVTGGGYWQQLDVYHNPSSPTPTPAVVWIHGGGWNTGNKENSRALILTNYNVAVVPISYRLTTNSTPHPYGPFPAQIHDCKSAVRWLRANAATYNIDPNRIGVWGQSAGAHLAALLANSAHTNTFDVGQNLGFSSRVQAVVDLFGPTDLSLYGSSQPGDGLSLYLGGTVQSSPPSLSQCNPVNYVNATTPPFLIYHGTADTTVPLQHSQLLHNALTNAGVPSTFTLVNGGQHFLASSYDAPIAQWLVNRLSEVDTNVVTYSNLTVQNGTFSAQFNVTSNRSYRVQGSTNLVNWVNVTNFVSHSTTHTFQGNTANSSPRFFKVVSP